VSTFDEIRRVRLEKVKLIRQLGINPYPSQSQKDYSNTDVVEKFNKLENKKFHVTGRIISWRDHGQLIFCHIQDQSGKLQIFIKKNDLTVTDSTSQTIGPADLKLLDIGDFIEVFGVIGKSIKGEVSVFPGDIKILSKSIRSLPEKWSGLQDQEIIFRRRYLDLVMNPDRKELFIRKSKFWNFHRLFLKKHGFIEVETPIMELVTGGADARPFVTHHHALNQDYYLRISTELYQKRLIGGGFEKIFTIGPNFRNEGIDDEHLQEFYQCEWYWAYGDYRQNMDLVEAMFKYISQNLYHRTTFTRGKHTFNLNCKWPRISYDNLIKNRFSIDIFNDSEEKILKLLKQQQINIDGLTNRARIVDNLWKIVCQEISGPIFVTDEPKFTSPLAKSHADNELITERFHVIIAGSELGNGYSELNDPVDQYQRFLDQQKNREGGDEEAQMMDIDFVEMLEYGMPPTTGYGQSERIFWFFENVTGREGTLFPQVKSEISAETRRLYQLPKVEAKNTQIKTSQKGNLNNIYNIDPAILKNYPSVKTGIAIIEGVEVKKSDSNLENLKKEVEQKYKGFTLEDINKISSIEAYRKFFRSFGVDPASRHPSPDALLRRIVQGKGLYNINTLVDAYNVACLETNLGMSAMNLDKLELPVTLRFANEGEQILLLGGEESKTTKAGEVVYTDSKEIITLDLNYRDCDKTKITLNTENVLLYVDGCPGISDSEIEKALDREIELIQKFCGGTLKLKDVSTHVSLNQKIIVGQVMEIKDHPNAQNLKVVIVKVSETETHQIVCGCDNFKVGDFVPVALPGTSVPIPEGGTQTIAKIKLRGVESDGMLCSPLELGISSDHDNIHILPKKGQKFLGQPISTIL
jgi:lysyl-tRNA synthetase class 2